MGCWGITAFESDAGLDSVGYIRQNLPRDGKLELEKIIEALQKDDVRLPEVTDGQSHTSPMALAEIVVKFLDHDTGGLDYDDDWAAKDKKFADITSFSASKESLQWLRDYISDTLQYARENAKFSARKSTRQGGWFEEQDWLDWQWHMEKLTVRLDELIASPENRVELLQPRQQENGPAMKDENSYQILEHVCATTPDNHHYLLLQAQNKQTGEKVWAVGDDQVCAVTTADFIRNSGVSYNDVLIQEFPYEDNTPESVGEWRPLIEELVRHTLRGYLDRDGLVHVYPQWLPEDVELPLSREEMFAHADHVILYDNDTLDVVPRTNSPTMGAPRL